MGQSKLITVFCRNTQQYYDVPRGLTLRDIYDRLKIQMPYPCMACVVNYKLEDLDYTVYKPKDLRWLVHRKNYATIATLTFEGLQLRDLSDWRPYLPYSKAIRASTGDGDYCLDNGKVISCRKFTVSLCDLDMRIVFDQYRWDRTFCVR